MPKVYVYDSYDTSFPLQFERERPDAVQRRHDTAGSGVPRVQQSQRAVDDDRRHGGVESDPPHLRQRHPGGVRFQAHLGGWPRQTSQHYAGVAFDVGQSTTAANRRKITRPPRGPGAWGYVEPLSMTPTWVHFDRRYGKPACRSTTAGYPTLRRGSRSTYVLILQDALNALGYSTNTLDGIFGKATENALKACQRRFSLTADGVCGCASWRKIAEATVGIGKTATVIDA